MIWATDTLRILAISQLLMAGMYFLLNSRAHLARLVTLLAVCLVAYILADHSALVDQTFSRYLLNRVATVTPFLLYVIAFRLFADCGKIPQVNWALAGYYMLARLIGVPLYDPEMDFATVMFVLIYLIPQILILYFSVLAVILASRGYPADLVEERRRFRVYFVVGAGIMTALRTINGFLDFNDPFLDRFSLFALPPIPDYLLTLYVLLITFAFNLSGLRLHEYMYSLIQSAEPIRHPSNGSVVPPHQSISAGQSGLAPITVPRILETSPNPANAALIARIIDKMEGGRLYTRPGLTIAELARETSIQEYRLRRLINKELRFKNFNQFLNHYRLREASQRLLERGTTVSSIALDIGYGSLSSFNSAFKAMFGMTPSEYRQAPTRQSINSQPLEHSTALP